MKNLGMVFSVFKIPVPVEDYKDVLSLDNCPDLEMNLREKFLIWNDLISGINWPHPSYLCLQCTQTF